MKKYLYWTFVTKVGKEFINKIKIGDHISADYKKKEWEIIDDKGRISFMCSGIYNCRTLTTDTNENKNNEMEKGINRNVEILKFKLDNPKYFKMKINKELKAKAGGKMNGNENI